MTNKDGGPAFPSPIRKEIHYEPGQGRQFMAIYPLLRYYQLALLPINQQEMTMQVDETFTISDGNGGTLQAKVTDFDRYYVWYKTRKSNRGAFSKRVVDASRKKFRQLIDDVKTN